MLSGSAFFVDRDEGTIWCDSCAPAEVVLLVARSINAAAAGGSPGRFMSIESGELLVHWRSQSARTSMRAVQRVRRVSAAGIAAEGGGVTSIDEILRAQVEQKEREAAEAEERRLSLVDPFKKPKREPGRALVNHGTGGLHVSPTVRGESL